MTLLHILSVDKRCQALPGRISIESINGGLTIGEPSDRSKARAIISLASEKAHRGEMELVEGDNDNGLLFEKGVLLSRRPVFPIRSVVYLFLAYLYSVSIAKPVIH